MTATNPDDDTDRSRIETKTTPTSRRTLLKTTAVVGATASLGGVALAQSGGDAIESTTIKFGGKVAGWQGRAPSSIKGQTNPTLTLEAGTEYTVMWTNLDGQPHNFQVLDSDGNVLHKSEIMSEKGNTQTTSFTATKKMAQYNCAVHPSSMVGNVGVAAQSGSSANETDETNGSNGNESGSETTQSQVNQSPNGSTNESGGPGVWNVTGNGSAQPGVVDNASANSTTNGTGTTGNATTGTTTTGTAGNATTGAATTGTTGSTTQGTAAGGTTAGASTTGSNGTGGNGSTAGSGGNATGSGGNATGENGNTTTGGSGPGFGALAALGGLAVGAARLLIGRDD